MAPFEWLARESANPNIQQTTSASDQRLQHFLLFPLRLTFDVVCYSMPVITFVTHWRMWHGMCNALFDLVRFVQRSLINAPSVKQSSRSSWLTSCTSLVHCSYSSMEYALGSEFSLMPKTNIAWGNTWPNMTLCLQMFFPTPNNFSTNSV